jgi:hypothetical protein
MLPRCSEACPNTPDAVSESWVLAKWGCRVSDGRLVASSSLVSCAFEDPGVSAFMVCLCLVVARALDLARCTTARELQIDGKLLLTSIDCLQQLCSRKCGQRNCLQANCMHAGPGQYRKEAALEPVVRSGHSEDARLAYFQSNTAADSANALEECTFQCNPIVNDVSGSCPSCCKAPVAYVEQGMRAPQ